jgi:hypothetical protein
MNRKLTQSTEGRHDFLPRSSDGPSPTVKIDSKEAERIRKFADSFDPMKATRWTVWQALAWIFHRDVDKVRECTEIWKQIGPRFAVKGAALGPFRAIWDEVSDPPGLRRIDFNDEVKGWHELQRALESGRVKSSGRDVATGSKREVSQLEWEDLRFANQLGARPDSVWTA